MASEHSEPIRARGISVKCTSTSELPTLSYTWSLNWRYPFRAEPPRIGHHREYPPPRPSLPGAKCIFKRLFTQDVSSRTCFWSVYVVNVFNVIHVIQTSDPSINYNSIQLDTNGVYGYQGYYYNDRYSSAFWFQKSVWIYIYLKEQLIIRPIVSTHKKRSYHFWGGISKVIWNDFAWFAFDACQIVFFFLGTEYNETQSLPKHVSFNLKVHIWTAIRLR